MAWFGDRIAPPLEKLYHSGFILKVWPFGEDAVTEKRTPSEANVPMEPVSASTTPPPISKPSLVVGSGSAMAAATIQIPAPVIPSPASNPVICFQVTRFLAFAAFKRLTAETRSFSFNP